MKTMIVKATKSIQLCSYINELLEDGCEIVQVFSPFKGEFMVIYKDSDDIDPSEEVAELKLA